MTGNLWEWCLDWSGPIRPVASTDRRALPQVSIADRGGSWGSAPGSARSANRATNPQAEASAWRGFRVALALRSEALHRRIRILPESPLRPPYLNTSSAEHPRDRSLAASPSPAKTVRSPKRRRAAHNLYPISRTRDSERSACWPGPPRSIPAPSTAHHGVQGRVGLQLPSTCKFERAPARSARPHYLVHLLVLSAAFSRKREQCDGGSAPIRVRVLSADASRSR